jgi:hypothetical protein
VRHAHLLRQLADRPSPCTAGDITNMRKLPNGHIPRGLHPGDPLGLNGCVTVRSMENYPPFEADMPNSAMHTPTPPELVWSGTSSKRYPSKLSSGGGAAGDGCEVTQGR